MSTAVASLPDGAKLELTKAQLDSLMTDLAQRALGDKLTESLKPLTEKQESLMSEMLEIQKRQEQRAKPDAEKGLMLARQARAMYLGKGDPERAIH